MLIEDINKLGTKGNEEHTNEKKTEYMYNKTGVPLMSISRSV